MPTQWNGAQLHRASWFNAKIKEAKNTYRFIQLVMYSTIPIPKSGATAVYNDEHACDHHFEQNVGSWAAPCKRRRTTATAASAAAASTTPGSLRPHGPIPDPTSTAGSTYAAAVAASPAPASAPSHGASGSQFFHGFRVPLTATWPSRWWAPCAVVSLGEGSVCVAIVFVITTG